MCSYRMNFEDTLKYMSTFHGKQLTISLFDWIACKKSNSIIFLKFFNCKFGYYLPISESCQGIV
jgi:hypothetical protein